MPTKHNTNWLMVTGLTCKPLTIEERCARNRAVAAARRKRRERLMEQLMRRMMRFKMRDTVCEDYDEWWLPEGELVPLDTKERLV